MKFQLIGGDEGALCFGPLGPTPRRDDRYTLLFVRAHTIIHPLAMITVHAQHLEPGRESIAFQPEVGVISSRTSLPAHLPTVRSTIVVHVIERKKLRFCFLTTSTDKSTIVVNDFFPNLKTPSSVALSDFSITTLPPDLVLASSCTFHAAGRALRLAVAITCLRVWRFKIKLFNGKNGWTYSALLRALARRFHPSQYTANLAWVRVSPS